MAASEQIPSQSNCRRPTPGNQVCVGCFSSDDCPAHNWRFCQAFHILRQGSLAFICCQTEGHWKRPGGHIVEECVLRDCLRLEQRSRQTALRLRKGHDERSTGHQNVLRSARVILSELQRRRTLQTVHMDSLSQQNVDHAVRQYRILIRTNDKQPLCVGTLQRRLPEIRKILKPLFPALYRSLERRYAGDEVIPCALEERQRAAVRPFDCKSGPTAAGLLIRHADGSVERRPGITVPRIEHVERLADIIRGSY